MHNTPSYTNKQHSNKQFLNIMSLIQICSFDYLSKSTKILRTKLRLKEETEKICSVQNFQKLFSEKIDLIKIKFDIFGSF
jgi:hypothetical protein